VLFTSQNFNRASGKLGALVADSSRPAPYFPSSLPVASNSFRVRRAPASSNAKCRLQPSSLLRDCRAAWLALTPPGRANWNDSSLIFETIDRFGTPLHHTGFQLFSRLWMLSSSHSSLDHFDFELYPINFDFSFFRFRSLSVALHYSGFYVFTLTGFIPEYWVSTSPYALLFFSHAAVPSTVRARYRGALPHKQHIGFGATAGRDFSFDFLSDYIPDPYQPARIFFQLRGLDIYPVDYYDPPAVYYEFSKITKGFVDYVVL
jgi:hypothetical protein